VNSQKRTAILKTAPMEHQSHHMTIVRVWRGVVPKTKSAKYLEYLSETGMKDYARTPGNTGATILTRDDGNNTEFLVVSYWESMDAIKKFAGDDASKAKYYPKDTEFLLELEASVKHYRIAFKLKADTSRSWAG